MDFTNVSQNYEAGTKVLASQFVFGLSRKTQWLSGLYYADFISFYSPTQLCGGGTTKSNSNELPISVPLSFFRHAENIRTFPVEKGDFKGNVLQWKQIDRMEQ